MIVRERSRNPSGTNHDASRSAAVSPEPAGGGHRSGPGEHSEWQAAMKGLDTLRPLADGRGWGPPIALPASVAALKRLRKFWLGDAGWFVSAVRSRFFYFASEGPAWRPGSLPRHIHRFYLTFLSLPPCLMWFRKFRDRDSSSLSSEHIK